MYLNSNPYILFLILLLLVLGTDPNAGKKIDAARKIMDRMMVAMNNFSVGMQSMSSEFDQIQVMLQGADNFYAKK